MVGHRGPRPALVLGRLGRAQQERVGEGHLGRDVAGQRVVGGGLVGDEVEPLAALPPRPARSPRHCRPARSLSGLPAGGGLARPGEGLGRVAGQPVDVADVEPPAGARLVDLDGEAHALVHRHRQRLGAAHPAEPGGQRHASRAATRRNAGEPPRRTSRTSPGGCPACRCRSTSPRSSGRTSSGPRRSSSRKTSQVAHLPTRFELAMRTRGAHGWVRTTPTGLPDWTSSVSSSASVAQLADDRVEGRPASAPRARSRRRRRGGRGPRPPPGRGCS